jgi:putative addiction module component (TIGR02574 family)
MGIAEIHQLPLNDKLQIMEAIWDDLRSNAEAVLVPDWHKNLLDERRNVVEQGKEQVLEWDEVKDSLGSKRP